MQATNLDEYMACYGQSLVDQAGEVLDPLHDPERDQVHRQIRTLKRRPFTSQAHFITGFVKMLQSQTRAGMTVGQMGTGKTLMGMSIAHCHADGRPYRALILCPGHLVRKWKRELEDTIPNVKVRIIDSCRDVLSLRRDNACLRPEWYIISRDTAKLGSRWHGAAVPKSCRVVTIDRDGNESTRIGTALTCPRCGMQVRKRTKQEMPSNTFDRDAWNSCGQPVSLDALSKRMMYCDAPRFDLNGEVVVNARGEYVPCGEPLWQHNRKINRFEPAKYIHRRLDGFFDYLIADEAHEEAGYDSAQANALGSLASACKRVIAMTGTLCNGKAESLRPMLFRLAPQSVVEEGFRWDTPMPFSERYGRIETVITERHSGRGDRNNTTSRGSNKTVIKYCRPGIMPTLFSAHLIGKSAFITLEDMQQDLPAYTEFVTPIPMDPELKLEYSSVEGVLRDTVRQMLARKDKRLLGAMLSTLLCYPDHPYCWQDVGYYEGPERQFVPVVRPRSLSSEVLRPKEKKLVELCRAAKAAGRQAWVYCIYNGKHDVESRLLGVLAQAGLRTNVLTQSVEPVEREEWIEEWGPGTDVMISHPKLVETGVDLFSKKPNGHNFCTLIFYETGYQLSSLRQAAARAYRLMQPKDCEVHYLYYEGTMQEKAMQLMSRKLVAAEALEGKFSAEGLVSLAGDDSVELALARELAGQLPAGEEPVASIPRGTDRRR